MPHRALPHCFSLLHSKFLEGMLCSQNSHFLALHFLPSSLHSNFYPHSSCQDSSDLPYHVAKPNGQFLTLNSTWLLSSNCWLLPLLDHTLLSSYCFQDMSLSCFSFLTTLSQASVSPLLCSACTLGLLLFSMYTLPQGNFLQLHLSMIPRLRIHGPHFLLVISTWMSNRHVRIDMAKAILNSLFLSSLLPPVNSSLSQLNFSGQNSRCHLWFFSFPQHPLSEPWGFCGYHLQ